MYLKNKSSNANSTHLKKESSTLAFPPSSCWLGPVGSGAGKRCPRALGTSPGRGRRLDGPSPCAPLFGTAEAQCRLGTGERTTVGLGTVAPGEKLSSYWGGHHRQE